MINIRKFAITILLAASAFVAQAASYQWGGTSSLLWSDVANWNVFPSGASSVPGPLDSVYFEDQLYTTGSTNAPLLVNNVVNTSTAIGSLNYTAQAYDGNSHFYTTLIPGGVTLTVGGLGTPALNSTPAAMSVGDVQFTGTWIDDYWTNYSTITGAGTLSVNDANSLISVGEFQQATLDLLSLSNFKASVKQVWLGVSPDLGSPDYYGPHGWLVLGATNTITTTPNQSAPGILIGAMITSYSYYGGNNFLAVGGTNRFNTDGLVVGGYRNGYNPSYLMFGNAYPNSTFTLRGSDGSSAASVFSVGDMSANWASYTTIPQDADDTSVGVVDFSGGVVDILVNNLYLGSSSPASVSYYTGGNGTLIAERGTITATNVYLGRKIISQNDSYASGTLILRSNVSMNVVKDFSLYDRTNGNYYSGTSLLMVSNSAVLNVGGNITWTNTYAYDPGANVIALGGGTIKMTGAGQVTAPNLFGFGSISNAGSIVITNSLSMNGDSMTGIGTLNLSSNLTIGPAVKLTFAVGASSSPSVSDHLNVGGNVTFNNNPVALLFSVAPAAGNYHLIDYSGTASGSLAFPASELPRGGTLTFHQPSSGWAGFTATTPTPATLQWAGIAGSSDTWSANNSSPQFKNWTNSATAQLDYYYQFDNVVFGETPGVATEVMLDGTLIPSTITVTGSSSYTFSGGGKISGAPVFNINQAPGSTFSFGANGGSDLTTPINVNSGTFRFTDGSAIAPGGNGGVNVASGAAFDLNGYSYPYNMGQITIAGTGLSGSGAIYTSSGSQNGLKTLNLSADAAIGLGSVDYSIGMPFNFDSIIANALNLNGHTLSLAGTNAFILQFANVGNGNINLAPGGNLSVYNCNVSGSGSINLPDGSTLSLWDRYGYQSSTMGAINKSLVVSNAVFQNNNSQSYFATSLPDYFGGVVTLNGALTLVPTYQPMAFSAAMQGAGSLILDGPNTVTSTAANTFTGPTTLSQGTLVLSGSSSLASTKILVDPPATFDVTGLAGGYHTIAGQSVQVDGKALGNVTIASGSTVRGGGSISGSVTLALGGTLAVGSTSLGGTLTVSNNLTINGGTNIFKWGGPDDLVAVGGNLNITAPVVIKVKPVDLLNGRHVMYKYSGSSSGVTVGNFIFQSTRPLGFVLDTSVPGEVAVIISGSSVLSWVGGAPSAPTAWDENTTTNWLKDGNLTYFLGGDSVQFDDSSSHNLVSIPADVDAGAVIFANASKPYTFAGAGGITAGSMKTLGGASVTFNNTGDITMTGSGLALNAGTLTFAQPTNAVLTAKISGGGLAKSGTNTLKLVGPDSTGFTGAFNVNGGTVKLGTTNVLGASLTTVASGATLDVNGLSSTNARIYTAGAGVDGQGAINNNSSHPANALANISFNDDTTLGAAGARWDIIPGGSGLQGNNKKLTKVTPNDIWIRTGSDTGLGDIEVQTGRLIFAEPGTLLGNTSSNIVVRTNAALGFANGIQDLGGKHARLDAGGKILVLGSGNQFNGGIVLSNGLVQAQFDGGYGNPQLTLGGNLSGPAALVAQGVTSDDYGTVTLSGTNTYTGGTVVQEVELDFASSLAIPQASSVVMLSRNPYYYSGTPIVGLLTNVVSPVDTVLEMQTVDTLGDASVASLYGDGGTWAGPITIIGDQSSCTANFYAGAGGLTVAGAVDGSGFSGDSYGNGGVKIGGDSVLVSDPSLSGVGVRFNNALQFNGSLSCDNAGFGGFPGMSKLVLASAGNAWNDMYWQRGVIQIGADEALPPAPITIGTLLFGADHRVVLDLNGHNQTLVNWMEFFKGNDPTWFGNSSTNANAVLTYAGTGVNTWTAFILDSFDTNAPVQKQTSLSVTAGYLQLIPFPYGEPAPDDYGYFPSGPPPYPFAMAYTGPTTISGGTLEVDKLLGVSPVTVNGSGTLSGNNGVLLGSLTVAAGGTLAPGVSPDDTGTLAVSNNVSLAGTCVIKVNLAAAVNDQVIGISNLTYGGSLAINNISGSSYHYSDGQIIKLFDAAHYNGSFSSIVFPGVVSYDASKLTVDGTIKVVTAVSTAPATITSMVVGGNKLRLNWPYDHTGWLLQVQTNGLNAGIGSVWYDVDGSTATNQVTVPINPANPTVFYRMVYP